MLNILQIVGDLIHSLLSWAAYFPVQWRCKKCQLQFEKSCFLYPSFETWHSSYISILYGNFVFLCRLCSKEKNRNCCIPIAPKMDVSILQSNSQPLRVKQSSWTEFRKGAILEYWNRAYKHYMKLNPWSMYWIDLISWLQNLNYTLWAWILVHLSKHQDTRALNSCYASHLSLQES